VDVAFSEVQLRFTEFCEAQASEGTAAKPSARGRHAVGPHLAHASRLQHSTAAARCRMVYPPPPGVACTTNKESSKDTNRFQALYRLKHAALKQGLRRGSGQLSALIQRSAWKLNSRKFMVAISARVAPFRGDRTDPMELFILIPLLFAAFVARISPPPGTGDVAN
jgi:hypothetical protein